VEVVVGHRASWDGLDQPRDPTPAAGAEPLQQGIAEAGHLDPFQQAVADPVGLHHLGVQRVGAAVAPAISSK
jgi:hypothetical protein